MAHANCAEFQVKGRTLGMDEHMACGAAPIESHQTTLDATGLKGFSYPATSCKVFLDTVAGIKPTGPALLLFWKGKLIRLIVRFEEINLIDSATLRTAFINSFGKPKTKRSSFRTDTWTLGKHKLELEWDDSDSEEVGAYMTDTGGWQEYDAATNAAKAAIKALDEKSRANDLKN